MRKLLSLLLALLLSISLGLPLSGCEEVEEPSAPPASEPIDDGCDYTPYTYEEDVISGYDEEGRPQKCNTSIIKQYCKKPLPQRPLDPGTRTECCDAVCTEKCTNSNLCKIVCKADP